MAKTNRTTPYSVNLTGKISKIQRKWMKYSGEWWVRIDKIQSAQRLALIEKTRKRLSFTEDET